MKKTELKKYINNLIEENEKTIRAYKKHLKKKSKMKSFEDFCRGASATREDFGAILNRIKEML